jgi:hypothetical protein
MSRVCGAHHVLGVEHLLGQFGHGQGSVLLAASTSEWCESDHEEVESWEGDQVDCQLPQVTIELTREPQTAGDSTHGYGDQMVQVAVCGGGQLQCSKADVVQGFIVYYHSLIGVFNQLVD